MRRDVMPCDLLCDFSYDPVLLGKHTNPVRTAVMGDRSSFSFGWFRFRPKWLQFLNTPRWFLFFLCQYFFTESVIIFGVYPGSISTIERRFGFTSWMTGWLTSSFDICATILTPLVSYTGGSRKKPVFCGIAFFILGLGFFVMLLPHVLSEKYQAGQVSANVSGLALCAANQTSSITEVCDKDSVTGNLWYYSLFILGMVLAGVGTTPMYTLGVPYIDENVKPKALPMYVGITEASGILGAVVGFVVIFLFLSIFVDLGVQTSLTPDDQRWVGAWWLGFAIFGAICVFWSLWLLGFPKQLPGTRERREIEMTDKTDHDEGVRESDGFSKLSDIPKATKLVFSRLPFVTITLGGCMESLVISSSVAFMPKVLQFKFRMLPGSAAILNGCVSIAAALMGNLIGAYINKKLNLSMRGAAKMCFIVAIFGFVTSCFLYINCDQVEIVGVNQPYINSSSPDGLSSPCNSVCDCSGVSYSPVCAEGYTYFSPCHAGCSSANASQSYSNCSCVVIKSEAWGEANSAACGVNCGVKLILFMVVLFLASFFTFLHNTPGVIVTLRSNSLPQRPYAVGIQMILMRLLGSIPGPVVMGSLIDRTCILWNISCGKNSNCLEYNTTQLTFVIVCLFASCKAVTVVFFCVTWLLCRQKIDSN